MVDLNRWTGPVRIEGFRFGEPGTPPTFAERVARMSDQELEAAVIDVALRLLDYWRNGGDDPRAMAILASVAPQITEVMTPQERFDLGVPS